MMPADRLAFWTQVHPRLARLGNRFDQAALAKVMGEVHAKVPMVATGDPGLTAGKIEIAEHNAGLWTRVREHTLATVEEKRELVAKLTAEIAEGKKQAADADGRVAEDRRKGGTAQGRRGRGRWQTYRFTRHPEGDRLQ